MVSSSVPLNGGPPPIHRASRLRALGPLIWPLLAMVVLLAFNYFRTGPDFFAVRVVDGKLYGSLIDILRYGSQVLLLSIGMTLVIGTGGIDLSVGAIMALAGAVAASLINPPEGSPFVGLHLGGSLLLVLGAGMLTALICGLWNGVLVAFLRLQPIIATLILMVAGRGIAQLVTNGQIPTFETPGFSFLGNGSLFMLPAPFVIAAVVFIGMMLLVRWTALGLYVEAVGNNREASRIAGVNATGVRLACYLASGLLAGVAGLIATAQIRAADVNNIGLTLELDAILAAAIGGTSLAGGRFSLLGSALGALVIQTLTTTIYASGYKPESTYVIKALVVIVLCLMQSPKFRKIIWRRRTA
ncbi:MAG: ABC transporter permease [Tepidisphaeraceae bacterium]